MVSLKLCIFIISVNKIFCADNSPFIKTRFGGIIGYLKKSFIGKKYTAFEGIPYAHPPIGKRRFQVNTRILFIRRVRE